MSTVTLLSTRDAAQRLGVSVPTVTKLARDGVLVPAAKAPGRRGAYLFDEHDVERVRDERSGAL